MVETSASKPRPRGCSSVGKLIQRPQPHHLPYPSASHPRPSLNHGLHAAVAAHHLAELAEYEAEDCMPAPARALRPHKDSSGASFHQPSITVSPDATPPTMRKILVRRQSQLSRSTSAAYHEAPCPHGLDGPDSPPRPSGQPTIGPQSPLTEVGQYGRPPLPGVCLVGRGTSLTEAPQRSKMSSSPLFR
jgi:hypothetical protein